MSIFEKLNGRKVDVNYETGYHFIIEYLMEFIMLTGLKNLD